MAEYVGGMGSKLAGNVSNSAIIKDLVFDAVESNVWSVVESLVGVGKLQNPTGAQIALRFPDAPSLEEMQILKGRPLNPREWHTDGLRQGNLTRTCYD